ncbi:MAG: hypothetical protein HKM89_12530 [Gemmatimonadales bacterium]|nr:hypothetical protein [Gemmatimonadales bacterium]
MNPELETEGREVGVLEVLDVLLKHWRLIVGFPLAITFFAALITLILPTQYTATTSFVPEGGSEGSTLPSGLSGIASQFGISLPVGRETSPEFYSDVLYSRTIVEDVLQTAFPDPKTAEAGTVATLLDLLEIEGDSLTDRLQAGRKDMAERTSVRVKTETGVVSLSVETPYPSLSADVANQFVTLLNRFNLETRQSNAKIRREFAEARNAQAETELREAEEDLRRFLEENRRFSGSPQLQFQHDRLQRQVTIRQEVLTALRREYEQARIQEVNDTPVITVIDTAVPPYKKSSPHRTIIVIVVFVLASLIAIAAAFGREFVQRAKAADRQDYKQFENRWAVIKSELRRPFGRRG